MLLKEACRYQNVLKEIISGVDSFLARKSNLVVKTKTHYQSKAIASATDKEEIIKDRTNGCEIEINELIDFYDYLVAEKIKLANAISEGKKKSEKDIDVLVETNKSRQSFANSLKAIGSIKGSETEKIETGQSFNIAGDPITYKYNAKEVVSIDFDRNKVKAIEKKISRESTEISNQIDLLTATIVVDYEPIFEMSTTNFEDAYETYKDSMK